MGVKKAFVIGHPISHSLSPKLHGFWLKKYGIDGTYEAINCPPEYLHKTIKKLASTGYAGGNVTIPHKEKVMMICDVIDPTAQKIGAVNTLHFKDGKIYGFNTDAYGFSQNLEANGVVFTNVKNTILLGAGGASRAIIYALKERGVNVTITNRTFETAKKLADEFGCKAIKWEEKEQAFATTDLLINATSLGMKNHDELQLDLPKLPDHAIVTDIVYNPLETELLKQAAARGLKTVDGLGMLLHQAAAGFEKWFGKKPEVTKELYYELARSFV